MCSGSMRRIAFITEVAQIRKTLEHIGVDIQAPPRIAPAHGPPPWDDCDAQGAGGAVRGARIEPDQGDSGPAEPDDGLDQTRAIDAPMGERANRQCRRAVGRAVPMVRPSAAKAARASDAPGSGKRCRMTQRCHLFVPAPAKWGWTF